MSTGLGQQIFDAILRGDSAEAEKIKAKIKLRQKQSNEVYRRRNKGDLTLIESHLINNHGTPAPQIYNYLNKEFGEDWWEWDLNTIFTLLEKKIKSTIHPVMRDKISALRHLSNRGDAYDDWFMLNQLALSFSGSMSDFENLKFASPGAIINAIRVMRYVRPDIENKLSDSVKKFIIVLLKNDGIYTPPPSIMQYIGREMASFVDNETVKMWVKAHEKMKSGNFSGDGSEDVQALRLYRSEKSADRYFTNDITKD